MQTRHASIRHSERQDVVNEVAQLNDIADEPEDVQYPNPDYHSIDELPVIQIGVRCIAETQNGTCNYVCRGWFGMQNHGRGKASMREFTEAWKTSGLFRKQDTTAAGDGRTEILRIFGFQGVGFRVSSSTAN